jgi:ATP-binding cassette subfamily C protein
MPLKKGMCTLVTVWDSLVLLAVRERLKLAALAVAGIILSLVDVVAILLVGLAAAISVGERPKQLPNWSLFDRPEENLNVVLLLLAGALFLIKTLIAVFLSRYQHFFLASLQVAFARKILLGIFRERSTVMRDSSRAGIEWAVLRSTEYAFAKLLGSALLLVAEASLALFVLALFLVTDWLAAIGAMIYFSVILGVFQAFAHRVSKSSGEAFTVGSQRASQLISDLVGTLRELKTMGRLQYIFDQIVEARRDVAEGQARHTYLQALPRVIAELSLIIGAIVFVVAQEVSTGRIDVELIAVFAVGSLRLMSAMLPIQRSFLEIRHIAPSARQAQLTLRKQAAGQSVSPLPNLCRSPAVPDLGLASEVELREVSFAYPDNLDALIIRDVSLKIERGSRIAIIGPSGTGKTTLVDLILGLLDPISGTITIDGSPPKTAVEQTASVIGYVPQRPELIAATLLENIGLGIDPSDIDEDQVNSAIELAELGDFRDGLPHGLDTKLDSDSEAVSIGQLQRIGLARALYRMPTLLILDEATSALDAGTEDAVTRALYQLGKSITIITVAHRLSTVQSADRVILLNKGGIEAEGSFPELVSRNELVRSYVALMSLEEPYKI